MCFFKMQISHDDHSCFLSARFTIAALVNSWVCYLHRIQKESCTGQNLGGPCRFLSMDSCHKQIVNYYFFFKKRRISARFQIWQFRGRPGISCARKGKFKRDRHRQVSCVLRLCPDFKVLSLPALVSSCAKWARHGFLHDKRRNVNLRR